MTDHTIVNMTLYGEEKVMECTHLWDALGICQWCKINVRTVAKRLTAENNELKLQIESWKNIRDGVLAHIEQIEQEKLELLKEIERLKEHLRTDVGGKW